MLSSATVASTASTIGSPSAFRLAPSRRLRPVRLRLGGRLRHCQLARRWNHRAVDGRLGGKPCLALAGRPAVYWFQWGLHIRPSPSFWLGWTGKSATAASWASIPKRVEPMHLRRSAIADVLSLVAAHLATGRTSITPLTPQSKANA